jgi:hypothetical protein
MARALLADYDGDAASAGVPWSEVASRAEELYLHVIGPSRAHRLRRGAA